MTGQMSVGESIEYQANACATAGSQMYASLLRGLKADYDHGGVTAELLDGLSERPLADAIPLRLLAVGHRLALSGRAPALAAHYPSCGGAWSGDDITDVFLAVVDEHRAEFDRGVHDGVQTNEVGRAPVLVSGFALVARRHRLPLQMLEIGSSAGLLSRWDRYAYDAGATRCGDPASALRFGPEWWSDPRPSLAARLEVAARAGCDVAPIDVSSPEGRLRMLSFLWPDQLERFTRLRLALDIAASNAFDIDCADAGEWLHERFRAGLPDETATIVFHSIVWQYLPRATKDGVRAALRSAGEAATATSPLAWVRMEPATPDHADLRITTWPGGTEEVAAHVGYHGADVRWLLDDPEV